MGVGVVVAGLVVWRMTSPPDTPPSYEGSRPDIEDGGYVSVTHEVTITATPVQVWEWSNAPDRTLQSIIRFEDYPAVVDTTELVGDWEPGRREGDRRRVEFADGHYLAEEIVVDSGDVFRYMIWGFTNAQRFAVDHGLAEFQYVPDGDGTRLIWTYSFQPTVGLLGPVVERFLDQTMSPMMIATLDAMRTGIERDTADG
jgi:hypothetical protein